MRFDSKASGCNEEVLKAHAQSMWGYRETLRNAQRDHEYQVPESLLHTPFDDDAITEAESLAHSMGTGVQTVILVGIGGSDLGTRAIYDAMYHNARGEHSITHPKLVCFDTIEPTVLDTCVELFQQHTTPEELVLIVITKSGRTVETIVNANRLYDAFVQAFGQEAASRRTIYVGDANEKFHEIEGQGITCVSMPDTVGGRFSVFTTVGLVPLALLGVDIRQLCEGAQRAMVASTPLRGYDPAATLAAVIFENYTTGKTVHEIYFFHPELATLGRWYRQLLAESLGKERADGTRVGITPSICIGSTDLHSMGQLAFGGPTNRITTFVASPKTWQLSRTQLDDASPFMIPVLKGKQSHEAIDAIYHGVIEAYRAHNLPYLVIELEVISPRELGAWMALHMTAILYAAQMFGVNAFDQPAVEEYKGETRKLLSG